MQLARPSRLHNRVSRFGLCLVLSVGGGLAVGCPSEDNAGRFTANADGTITDGKTGPTWKRCSEGQSWDGTTCAGAASRHSWREAMALGDASDPVSEERWRLPKLQELASIIDKACARPAIDPSVFPATPAAVFWSSSVDGDNDDYAWYIRFRDGHASKGHKYGGAHVRLVRGG